MANYMIENNFAYTVKKQPEWFYKVLQKAHTIDNGYVRVLPNVTKDTFIKKLVMDKNTISQADTRDCAWTPTQRFTFDGKTVTVKNFKINEEQCLEDLDSIYSEMVFNSIGATKDKWPDVGEPQNLESAIMFHLQNSLSNDIERLIWGGEDNAVAGIHDGILDKALASADSIKVENPVTIDASNVLAEIQRVYNAIPDAVLNEGEFEPEKAAVKIFVGLDIMRYLKQALSTTPTNYQVTLPSFTIEGGKVFYMGIEICVVVLPANTMVAASRDNLYFATDLLSDTQEIRAQMGNDLKDENIWRAKGAYRADAGMIFEDEVVVYSAQ
jgi:hypothetical protein